MHFGTECPDGFLPVFSVDTEEEAEAVIIATCSLNPEGGYYSHDVALAMTEGSSRIAAFNELGEKMARVYETIKEQEAAG